MNCFQHPSKVAVAQCSNGCGRALCADCAEGPSPLCRNCAALLDLSERAELVETRSVIIRNIAINAVFLVAYIILLAVKPERLGGGLAFLVLVTIMLWGFLRFHSVMNTFWRITNLIVFAPLTTWGKLYFVGALFLSMFGIFVIPVVIVADLTRLFRLRGPSSKMQIAMSQDTEDSPVAGGFADHAKVTSVGKWFKPLGFAGLTLIFLIFLFKVFGVFDTQHPNFVGVSPKSPVAVSPPVVNAPSVASTPPVVNAPSVASTPPVANALSGTQPLPNQIPVGVTEQLGPSFDCGAAKQPLAQTLCADAELSRVDLRFAQAYWALLSQVGDSGSRDLKQEDLRFLDAVQQQCGISSFGTCCGANGGYPELREERI